MAYDTVANLIADAAVELGLVVTNADAADPYASTDQNIKQLLRLLKSGGRDILERREWSHLQKEYTFPTANGVQSYIQPADYRSLIPNSGWNRTTQIPLGGPVGAEYWQYRQAVQVGSVYYTNIRFWQGKIFLEATPTSIQTIAFEYNSSNWVGVTGSSLPNGNTKDAPTVASDIIYFDSPLVVRRLKMDWRKAKRFDFATELDDYDTALYAAELKDSPASTIYLGGRPDRIPRKIGRWNLPDTGVGS